LCHEARNSQFNTGIIMNNKYLGIVLLVVGVALVAWGYSVYDSAGSQISRAFSGDTPMEAWVGMVGGAVCVIFGILKIK
jgi:uncharacterized membrane protein YidH (DUF202 family)